MHIFDHWSIDWTNFSILALFFYIFTLLIINKLKGKTFFEVFFGIDIHYFVYFEVFYFRFLILILAPLIFIFVYHIGVHWYWYLYSEVIENFLWAVFKPYIWILFYIRLKEGHGKGDVWVSIIFDINGLF